jgi:hypothetical protein
MLGHGKNPLLRNYISIITNLFGAPFSTRIAARIGKVEEDYEARLEAVKVTFGTELGVSLNLLFGVLGEVAWQDAVGLGFIGNHFGITFELDANNRLVGFDSNGDGGVWVIDDLVTVAPVVIANPVHIKIAVGVVMDGADPRLVVPAGGELHDGLCGQILTNKGFD